ncbi:relaxase [Campylobacter sp. faydin G-140]|uniref:relaxase/mobilization nuclease domain-containing protein n=1 Tax=Campylobacter anatolicus TaxID=2829105 RepID=UPI001B9085F5|nr:relaxase [Campylobacter anatolicus]MBR8466533.1 relaxase [Campylobacter anatolicus]
MSLFDWGEHNEKYEKIKKLRKANVQSSRQQSITQTKIFKGFSSFNFFKNMANPKPAVVKMLSNLGKKGVKNALSYIIKNSENDFAFDENGNKVSADEILKDWSKDFSNNENAKEAWHLAFCIKENAQSPKAISVLKESVKEVMNQNFYGHKYAFVIHTHQNNPHIHVVINKRNLLTKKKIHFKQKGEIKDFFNDVRDNFSYSLGIRGFNYSNRNSLQKDLSKEFNKIKQKEILNDANTKDKINEIYLQGKQNLQNKSQVIEKKQSSLRQEYEALKAKRNDLLVLLNQYIKKQNKRRFKIAKQIKEINSKLAQKEKELLKNYDEKGKILYQINKINDDYLKHFKEQIDTLNMQKNFIYAFKKRYPNFKGASKTDIANYEKISRAIKNNSTKLDENVKFYTESNLIYSKMFNKDINLFKLKEQYQALNDNIYILRHSNINLQNQDEIIKTLEKNKEFIRGIGENRFKDIELRLSKNKNTIDKNSFIYKEYVKGIEFLEKQNILIKNNTNQTIGVGYSQNKMHENSHNNGRGY